MDKLISSYGRTIPFKFLINSKYTLPKQYIFSFFQPTKKYRFSLYEMSFCSQIKKFLFMVKFKETYDLLRKLLINDARVV